MVEEMSQGVTSRSDIFSDVQQQDVTVSVATNKTRGGHQLFTDDRINHSYIAANVFPTAPELASNKETLDLLFMDSPSHCPRGDILIASTGHVTTL